MGAGYDENSPREEYRQGHALNAGFIYRLRAHPHINQLSRVWMGQSTARVALSYRRVSYVSTTLVPHPHVTFSNSGKESIMAKANQPAAKFRLGYPSVIPDPRECL
jgi:hypothetical protein